MKGDLSQVLLSAAADAKPPGDYSVSSYLSVDRRLFGSLMLKLLKKRRFVAGGQDHVAD
jgi:hypothetical protein